MLVVYRTLEDLLEAIAAADVVADFDGTLFEVFCSADEAVVRSHPNPLSRSGLKVCDKLRLVATRVFLIYLAKTLQ